MFGFRGPFDFNDDGRTDPLESALGIESIHETESWKDRWEPDYTRSRKDRWNKNYTEDRYDDDNDDD